MRTNRRFVIIAALALLTSSWCTAQEQSVAPGINKSFEDADVDQWVKRFEIESRVIYKHRNEIVAALGLKDGIDIADVGAGTGFFTRMFAEKVGPSGTAYAVDISKNFIAHNKKVAKEEKIKNLKTVLCDEHSAKLKKNSVDIIFVCDTYHHFEFPFDTLASFHKALRSGGRLVIVDFERVKGVSTNFAMNHVRCGKGTASDEIRDSGFDFVEEIPMMEEQWIRVFKKRD